METDAVPAFAAPSDAGQVDDTDTDATEMPRVSVLDQTPIPVGESPTVALRNSIDLAARCEALGYHRYWVAEHHNTDGLAGSAPEILIGHIATATSTIRVGSGGVMLSHYAPYKVAETFRLLAALHPDRIDLAVGRAPGSDPVTAYALAQNHEPADVEQYPAMVRELNGFLHDDLHEDSPFRGRVRATPAPTVAAPAPPLWLLASSADSASFAAHFGLPLAFADFIARGDGAAVARAYREQYSPSTRHGEPEVLVAAGIICADTDEEAEVLASSVRQWRRQGLSGPVPAPEGVRRLDALRVVDTERKSLIVGSPETVRAGVTDLAERYGADEVMAVTIVWDHAARVRSYELLAEAMGCRPVAAPVL